MANAEPVREHRALEKLAGRYSGPERMHPSYFNSEERMGRAITEARVTLDGFAVVQDYVQELDDGSRFAGHGVFRYDMPSDTYEMHWFDTTGGPERVFRGGFADNTLVMIARAGDGWQRLSYDFNLDGGYRFRLETSEDGEQWNVAVEGDNIAERKPAVRAKKAGSAGKADGRKKVAAKKTAGRKASARKSTAKKTTARKAGGKKKTAKKAGAKKASAKKPVGKKATGKRKAGATRRVSPVERDRRQGKASKKIGPKKKATAGAATRRAVSQKKTQSAAQEGPRMPNLKKTSTRVGWHKTAAKGKREN